MSDVTATIMLASTITFMRLITMLMPLITVLMLLIITLHTIITDSTMLVTSAPTIGCYTAIATIIGTLPV
jgi:hypothetical protein